jgi:formate-dependent nitrite reductase membrane component NrfD
MQPYEWMTKYTPQTEWIDRRGVLLWLAFFFIELGAGMFLVASFFDNISGMLAGWLVCAVLGGGFHILFLGKPMRFWRMALSEGWKTSWISRGLIFVSLFLIFGLAHMIVARWAAPLTAVLVLTDIFAFLTIIYGGFAMNYVNGIALWNTALLPILFVVSGVWGGAEVILGVTLATAKTGVGDTIEEWIRILLIGFIILIVVYLMSVRYTSLAGKASVRSMVQGRWSLLFWIGVVVVGMLIPLTTVVSSYFIGLSAIPLAFIYVAILCGLLGDLAMRYLILRCGLYNPLIPTPSLSLLPVR